MSNAEEALFNLKKLRHVMPKYQYNELTVLLSELDGSGLFYNTAKHFDNLLRNATLSISKIPSLYGNKREVVYLHYKRGADSVDIYELGKGPRKFEQFRKSRQTASVCHSPPASSCEFAGPRLPLQESGTILLRTITPRALKFPLPAPIISTR